MTASKRAKKVEVFQANAKGAQAFLDLAQTYLDDGALLSAAANFRKAAECLEKAQAARNEAMGAPG